jgi:cyclohexadieny/prephenate dehydrogenase
MALSQLTIIGAGLIGGSIALAARNRGLAHKIVAIDTASHPGPGSPFDEWISADHLGTLTATLAESSLTVLCVPVRALIECLPTILTATSCPVTDCGSTKAAIASSGANHPARSRLVLGHPMAGHPEGGLQNARADLFVGHKWILCPSGSDASACNIVSEFVSSLGCDIVLLDANEHDRSVAVTSHLPQVVASALSVFAEEVDAKQAAGPGFASATRVAGGAEAMWRDIFETNQQAIGSALLGLGKKLQELGTELVSSRTDGALATLEKARKLRGDR